MSDFEKRFPNASPATSESEERKKFINRIESIVYSYCDGFGPPGTPGLSLEACNKLFHWVSIALGIPIEDPSNLFFIDRKISDFNPQKDFWLTLQILEYIHQSFAKQNLGIPTEYLNQNINDFLELSNDKLGVWWSHGKFYPSGEPLLDRELIETALQCLITYPNTNKDLMNALKGYKKHEIPGDVILNCYKAVESLAQELLQNDKVLSNNKDGMLSQLALSSPWGTILGRYIDFANEYGKHTRKENRHEVSWSEVEATLYLTCLIIRLALKEKKTTSETFFF